MRSLYHSTYVLILLVTALFLSSAAQAGVITVDATAKTIASDTDKAEAKGIKVVEGQVGFFVSNNTMQPQTVQLKVDGLTEPGYDVYVDGSYTREYTAADLKNGIQLPLNGTIADPDMMRCLNAELPRLEAEYKRLQKSQGEANRAWQTIRQAVDWVRSVLKVESSYRSANIIIAPSSEVLQKMSFPTKFTQDQTATGIWHACRNLQDARDRMYDNIKDPEIRNAAVAALTPVTFTTNYTMKNGKPHIDAKVSNDTNLPISGDITMALPKGWKTNAKNLKFNGLKSGKSFDIAFDLIPPAKSALAPANIPLSANVTIIQGGFEAKMKLKTTAVKTVTPAPQ